MKNKVKHGHKLAHMAERSEPCDEPAYSIGTRPYG